MINESYIGFYFTQVTRSLNYNRGFCNDFHHLYKIFQIRRCNQMNENVTLVDFGGHILFLDSYVIAPENML